MLGMWGMEHLQLYFVNCFKNGGNYPNEVSVASAAAAPLAFTGVVMSLLPRKNILTVAAVIDIALNAGDGVVSGKEVAARHNLPSRHLEPVLQALVREGILKGVRGPHGGYKLAREARRITAADILRAAKTLEGG